MRRVPAAVLPALLAIACTAEQGPKEVPVAEALGLRDPQLLCRDPVVLADSFLAGPVPTPEEWIRTRHPDLREVARSAIRSDTADFDVVYLGTSVRAIDLAICFRLPKDLSA